MATRKTTRSNARSQKKKTTRKRTTTKKTPTNKAKLLTWINRLIVIGNGLLIFFLLVCYLAPFVPPTRSYWVALIGLSYPILLIFNFIFIAYWAWQRHKAIYLSLGIWVLGIHHFFNYFNLNTEGYPAPDYAWKIMTYNVRYFNVTASANNEQLKAEQLQILDYIRQQEPDIFCGQEFSGKSTQTTQNAYDFLTQNVGLKYQYKAGGSSLLIASRYPIINKGTLHFEGTYNGAIFADIEGPHGIFRVYSMHLQSVGLGTDTEEVLKQQNLTSLDDKATQAKYKRIGSKLQQAFVMRTEQVRALHHHVKASPYPVLLAGDLNDTPISYAYSTLVEDMQDSFWEEGRGAGTTYAGKLPLLRIDYIMASPSLRFYNHNVLPEAYSDHYAVTSELSFR